MARESHHYIHCSWNHTGHYIFPDTPHFQVLPEGFDALYTADAKHATGHPDLHDHPEDENMLYLINEDDDHEHSTIPHWLPGLSLLAGFLTMLVFEFEHHNAENWRQGKDSCIKVRYHQRQRLHSWDLSVWTHDPD